MLRSSLLLFRLQLARLRPRLLRSFGLVALAAASSVLAADAAEYAQVRAGVELVFPRDHGAHPAYRTEWWYITGWVRDRAGRDLGVQITFFRNRPRVAEENPSAFAPRQLLFAHAALADAAHGRLRHDQRAARAGFATARVAETTTDVEIGDWSLRATQTGYVARVPASGFALDLEFRATQPILLQGAHGYSRKGPLPGQSSFYYSRPHLRVSGTIAIDGERREIEGDAWLDHEWSSEYLAAEAQGWDWAGLNLAGGGALMAFRIRDQRGATFWAGGTLRRADGTVVTLAPEDIAFTPLRRWRSPRTDAEYPVAMRLRAGELDLRLEPMMDDQELDSRASVGTVYWEGAVRALGGGGEVGRGYLELTGYWRPLKL